MKQRFSKIFGTALLAGVAVLATPSVQAIGINGEIAYAGGVTPSLNDLVLTPAGLGTATFLSNFSASVTSGRGAYSGLAGKTLDHSNLTISPFASVEPLWTINSGGLLYSFDLLTLQVVTQIDALLYLTGTGIAKITGFDDTPGKWDMVIRTQGAEFSFAGGNSSESTSVPDGGTTLALFGFAMLGIFGLRRLAHKQA